MLRVEEVAGLLNLSVKSVRRLVTRGKLPRLNGVGIVLIPVKALERYIEQSLSC